MALGYEWQNILSRRWKWYYGAEVEGKFIWDNSVDIYDYFDDRSSQLVNHRGVTKRRADRIALLPLVGLRFQISPYLFVGAEVKVEVLYEKFNHRRVTYWALPDDSVITTFSELTIENSNISFQPYTGIFLNLIL